MPKSKVLFFFRPLLVAWIYLFSVECRIAGNSTHDVSTRTFPAVPSVCPARTVNYITDTLPQQCLRTSWSERPGYVNYLTSQIETISGGALATKQGRDDSVASTILLLQANSTSSLPNREGSSSESAIIQSITSVVTSSSTIYESSLHPSETVEIGHNDETDSPLDNAHFLSFEEWKKQNLAKAGQSIDDVGRREAMKEAEPRRKPGTIHNALDSLGEDAEIEFDFHGFVKSDTQLVMSTKVLSERGSDQGLAANGDRIKSRTNISKAHRSKDAGKTCKERSNYASFDCAATVLKSNKECKGANSVLVENKDSYMLNKCSAENKFFIVELCDDILVDTVVLANYEFFSSMFRIFRVSVSDWYPVKLDKWRELGTFEAKNSREVQAFLIESPLIWARYLRIEFLEHYGNEYYCPVSLLRVHGTTMIEEFNHEMKGLRGEDEDEEDEAETENEAKSGKEKIETQQKMLMSDAQNESHESIGSRYEEIIITTSKIMTVVTAKDPIDAVQNKKSADEAGEINATAYSPTPSNSNLALNLGDIIMSMSKQHQVCPLHRQSGSISDTFKASRTTAETKAPLDYQTSRLPGTHTSYLESNMSTQNDAMSHKLLATNKTAAKSPISTVQYPTPPKTTNPSAQSNAKFQNIAQPPAASPPTQESFFKTIHKRLQLLESNSTLSLQYIEEQSRILRDAFSKVEKRQLAKTNVFLENLNRTVLTEIHALRNQYDQLWQSTVLELSAQREQSHHENVALSARLTLLADEIVFQKRIIILQFVLILLCLSLVIFSRSSSSPPLLGSNHIELPPLLQRIANKSSTNLTRYSTHLETPNTSPGSTRPSSGYGLFSGRGTENPTRSAEGSPMADSDRARPRVSSPAIEYSPPTPTSQHHDELCSSKEGQNRASSDFFQCLTRSSSASWLRRTPPSRHSSQEPSEDNSSSKEHSPVGRSYPHDPIQDSRY